MEAIKLKRIYTREDYNILKQDKKEYFKRIREKRKYKRTLRKKGITREARALNKYNSFTDIHKMIAFEKYKIYIYWDYYKEHAQDYITYIKYKTLKDQMRETENSIYKNLEKGTDKTTINNLIKEYNKLQYEYKKIFQDYKTIDIKRKIHREIKKYLEDEENGVITEKKVKFEIDGNGEDDCVAYIANGTSELKVLKIESNF